ncbi:glutathione peroxidase [Sphingomicrobium lutaoense]|uniref:Glutathione peroxidase n=1 Tax=Sphingomicrobium lutaoense TaxID=515949 RepID=A0A839Z1Q3_9SPHN|nr:glutathione peroxidase [Sphingomicrobium lutaoense]MBB3763602.1 glutathione peroxidase [Sphingomicrobium lutaoense]
MSEIYSLPVERPGEGVGTLEPYRGQVLLIVNTASQCGFTPQYEGLEKLQRDYGERGFSVLAFPCNQFGQQEPGSDAEIAQFCETGFGTSFPIFSKVDVNGEGAAPLFRHLKREAPGVLGTQRIKWNFTKFLVDREGRVVDRFAPQTTPDAIAKKIEALL